MNKREFLKAGLLAGAATQLPLISKASASASSKINKRKNWVWTNPDLKDTEDILIARYTAFKAAGITGVFFENDSEKHFGAAKAQGLEAHRWMWTFNRAELVAVHPEWYSKSRNGES